VTTFYYDDATALASTTYWYKITACNSAGESAKSDASYGTTSDSSATVLVKTNIRKAIKSGLLTIIKGNACGAYSYKHTLREVCDPPKAPNTFRELAGVNIIIGDETASVITKGDNKGVLHNEFNLELDVFFNAVDNTTLIQEEYLADLQAYFGVNYFIPDENGTATAFDCVYQSSTHYGLNISSPNYGITARFKVWYRQQIINPTVKV
jgi:hypothetical protein